ncbi:MAG: polymer-forming cytoskeletal protein [Acetatifactor sp.]|nr:polymer-forming cytoskeletal protein [Acetatifactor sp.]
MGFFSDLKEDLNQAVNELLPNDAKEEPKEAVSEEDATLKELEELEAMLHDIDEIQEEETARIAEEEAQLQKETEIAPGAIAEESVAEVFTELEKELPAEPEKEEGMQISLADFMVMEEVKPEPKKGQAKIVWPDETPKEAPAESEVKEPVTEKPASEETAVEKPVEEKQNQQSGGMEMETKAIDKSWILDLSNMEEMEETAVITAGMRVKGDILSNGSADVFGEVYGNVQVKGKLNVTGKISGNSKAADILADAAKINGDVISDGEVKIGVGSVVVGNVEATDAVIAGAVKGTIDVQGPVIIDATAVVLGNVKAKSIQINNGARIEGMCVLCYAEQSAAKFFEEQEV